MATRKKTVTTSTKRAAKTTAAKKPLSLVRRFSSAIKDLGNVKKGAKELGELTVHDEYRRTGAANILTPDQIRSGKKWTPDKVYEATMGIAALMGSSPLSAKQIKAFKANIKAVQGNFRGGIEAKAVLKFAARIDVERARRQIRVAMPVQSKGGRVRFLTNASNLYGATRHHVTVEFMSYEAAVSSGQGTPLAMARWLREQPLKYDCDCGRHTFYYRYITTIGAFNAGRAETGYPKETNPDLGGVACKHVVRTMTEIAGSANVTNFLKNIIEKGRRARKLSSIKDVKNEISQKEMKEQAAKMFAKPRTIRSGADIDYEPQAMRAAIQKAPNPTRASGANRSLSAMIKKDTNAALQILASLHGIDPAKAAKMFAQLKKD